MAPRRGCVFTGLTDQAGQDRIRKQALCLMQFTCINVRFANIARTVDQKGRLQLTNQVLQDRPLRVIAIAATHNAAGDIVRGQVARECRTNIPGTTEQNNHGTRPIVLNQYMCEFKPGRMLPDD